MTNDSTARETRYKLRVRGVGLISLAKFAVFFAIPIGILPTCLVVTMFSTVVRTLRVFLDGIATFIVPLPLNQQLAIDLVERLQLSGVLRGLRFIDDRLFQFQLGVGLTSLLAVMVLVVLGAFLGGLWYNLLARGTGGLLLELDTVDQ